MPTSMLFRKIALRCLTVVAWVFLFLRESSSSKEHFTQNIAPFLRDQLYLGSILFWAIAMLILCVSIYTLREKHPYHP